MTVGLWRLLHAAGAVVAIRTLFRRGAESGVMVEKSARFFGTRARGKLKITLLESQARSRRYLSA